jgi:putative transposase/transposase-like zinc-binding protein
VEQCDQCGQRVISYNSCRNRNCPKCQAAARAEWLTEREAELLPVPYFHVVFTLPQPIARLALQNPRVIYTILFRAVSETLLTIAADPKHLGAEIGFLAVLHTWGQNLHLHPHIHCVVPGGGISPDGSRWIACRESFFLPVRVLSRLFRNKFLIYLGKAFRQGKLKFFGDLASLAEPKAFGALCEKAARIDWVVYAKRPFGGPEQVLKYLARYTHRVAISNSRLLSLENGRVTFEWKDYAHGSQTKPMTLEAAEFMRRFLLHVLPPGFVRIRQFGLLANRVRKQKLALCRSLLGPLPPDQSASTDSPADDDRKTERQPRHCPACKTGWLVAIGVFRPGEMVSPEAVAPLPLVPVAQDTS